MTAKSGFSFPWDQWTYSCLPQLTISETIPDRSSLPYHLLWFFQSQAVPTVWTVLLLMGVKTTGSPVFSSRPTVINATFHHVTNSISVPKVDDIEQGEVNYKGPPRGLLGDWVRVMQIRERMRKSKRTKGKITGMPRITLFLSVHIMQKWFYI